MWLKQINLIGETLYVTYLSWKWSIVEKYSSIHSMPTTHFYGVQFLNKSVITVTFVVPLFRRFIQNIVFTIKTKETSQQETVAERLCILKDFKMNFNNIFSMIEVHYFLFAFMQSVCRIVFVTCFVQI